MARKRMKLYVWTGVLCDYTCGIAGAMATSAEEAKRLLIEGGLRDNWDGLLFEGQNYTEYEDATAFWEYGGG